MLAFGRVPTSKIKAFESKLGYRCHLASSETIILFEGTAEGNAILIVPHKFHWQSIFSIFLGSKNTVGEFFNPGLNCSNILDKHEDAKDGFYWITLKRSSPVKVGLRHSVVSFSARSANVKVKEPVSLTFC